jgi:hypothetical protein
MLCKNGKQLTPKGESGIYFICQFGDYKGSHCRFAKWCPSEGKYESSTDKNGNVCPNFAVEEVKI